MTLKERIEDFALQKAKQMEISKTPQAYGAWEKEVLTYINNTTSYTPLEAEIELSWIIHKNNLY